MQYLQSKLIINASTRSTIASQVLLVLLLLLAFKLLFNLVLDLKQLLLVVFLMLLDHTFHFCKRNPYPLKRRLVDERASFSPHAALISMIEFAWISFGSFLFESPWIVRRVVFLFILILFFDNCEEVLLLVAKLWS